MNLQQAYFAEGNSDQKFKSEWLCEKCNKTFWDNLPTQICAKCPSCLRVALPIEPAEDIECEVISAALAATIATNAKLQAEELRKKKLQQKQEELAEAYEAGLRTAKMLLLPQLYKLIQEAAAKGDRDLLYRFDPLLSLATETNEIVDRKLEAIRIEVGRCFLEMGYEFDSRLSTMHFDPVEDSNRIVFPIDYDCLEMIISW